jgi:hypothetical protein
MLTFIERQDRERSTSRAVIRQGGECQPSFENIGPRAHPERGAELEVTNQQKPQDERLDVRGISSKRSALRQTPA